MPFFFVVITDSKLAWWNNRREDDNKASYHSCLLDLVYDHLLFSLDLVFFFHEPPRPPDHYLVPDNLNETNLNCVWALPRPPLRSRTVPNIPPGSFQDTVGHKVTGAS